MNIKMEIMKLLINKLNLSTCTVEKGDETYFEVRPMTKNEYEGMLIAGTHNTITDIPKNAAPEQPNKGEPATKKLVIKITCGRDLSFSGHLLFSHNQKGILYAKAFSRYERTPLKYDGIDLYKTVGEKYIIVLKRLCDNSTELYNALSFVSDNASELQDTLQFTDTAKLFYDAAGINYTTLVD
jgi:hypothetical protein